jgi:hypothetical protein
LGADPTFRLTPSRGLLNQLALAGLTLTATADASNSGMIIFFMTLILCCTRGAFPFHARGDRFMVETRNKSSRASKNMSHGNPGEN